ncbi:MFS transporter [Pantoea sp. Aalb]|uniref:MFS transporter n=1 Tax=Pantoea sp. Aalb TaxID=2576762 RepID=UPI0013219B81|nr:MFS transporter [Pantoea sp. Aalb]MXP67581.1 MFS transporter [Pantoea sp. Aalb]
MNDNKMTPVERRATWGLGIIFSLRMLGMFMVLPVLTTYGMTLHDASEVLIGLAIGIYGLTQALFQIPFGLLSDYIGRKPIIISGLILFIIGSVIAANTTSIWGIILGRALQGSGAITAAVIALLSDLTREQNRIKAMSFIGISFGITFAIAMIIGPIITHIFDLHVLFWITAVLAGFSIIITLVIVPNAKNHILNRESNMVKGSILNILTNLKLLKINISIFYLHILLMSCFVVLPSQFTKVGFSTAEHWKLYLITMLISFIIVMPLIIYAEVKRCIKRVFISCIILILIAESILWHASNYFWSIVVGIQLFFIAFNFIEAILPSLISKESPIGYKGTAIALYSTSQFLGVAIGGSIGGWIYEIYNAKNVFLFGILITLSWLFISFSIKEPLYLSSLRLALNNKNIDILNLEKCLKEHPGIFSILIVPEEKSIYLKIDTKITNRVELETLMNKF